MAAQARREESRGLVPWVGAAAPLPQLPASAASSSARRPSAGLAKEEKRGSGKAMPLADDSTANSKAAGGRAFVFLPLPIATGLPLHVNGCFELSRWEATAKVRSTCSCLCCLPSAILFWSFRFLAKTPVNLHNGCCSNRRELWLGTDMAGAGARRAAWNQALLQDSVAAAYAQTLLRAAEVACSDAICIC